MKPTTILLTLFLATSSCAEPRENCATWMRTYVNKLVQSQSFEVEWFNTIGANDVFLRPETDTVGEILQFFRSASPDSKAALPDCKHWLSSRISEIQRIRIGATRADVQKILAPNGGISTPSAQIYSHKQYEFLKVRIEFRQVTPGDKLKYDPNDIVTAISKPYLGWFIRG